MKSSGPQAFRGTASVSEINFYDRGGEPLSPMRVAITPFSTSCYSPKLTGRKPTDLESPDLEDR
jgi:hypothetical protein